MDSSRRGYISALHPGDESSWHASGSSWSWWLLGKRGQSSKAGDIGILAQPIRRRWKLYQKMSGVCATWTSYQITALTPYTSVSSNATTRNGLDRTAAWDFSWQQIHLSRHLLLKPILVYLCQPYSKYLGRDSLFTPDLYPISKALGNMLEIVLSILIAQSLKRLLRERELRQLLVGLAHQRVQGW